MYIWFINSGGRYDIYIFSAQLNNISNKKKFQLMSSTQSRPGPCGLGWVELMWWLGWVEFFLIHYSRLSKKISLIRPNTIRHDACLLLIQTHSHSWVFLGPTRGFDGCDFYLFFKFFFFFMWEYLWCVINGW